MSGTEELIRLQWEEVALVIAPEKSTHIQHQQAEQITIVVLTFSLAMAETPYFSSPQNNT